MKFRTFFACFTFIAVLCTGCKSAQKTVIKDTPSHSQQIHTPSEKETVTDQTAVEHPLIAEARRWLGTPYRYGGQEIGVGTDCSGMIMEIFRTVLGIKLPRNSAAQQEYCIPVKKEKLETGDLVFFSSKTNGKNISHVGIFIDKGFFIHASSSRGVIVSHLDENYYLNHFHSCGRVPHLANASHNGKPAPTFIEPIDKTPRKEITAPEKTQSSIIESPAPSLINPPSNEQIADSIANQVRNAF